LITLITGVPGSGKTLFAVDSLAKFEGRPLFQCGVEGCAVPGVTAIGVDELTTVPDGAVVLVDEAQRVFPPRAVGALVPPLLRNLETHRHHGQDWLLTTQHSMLVDSHLRRLVGRHVHLERVFGRQRSRMFERGEVFDPKNYHEKVKAVASFWAFPKKTFALYKSAEIHTQGRKLPAAKLGGIVALLAATVGLIFFLVDRFQGKVEVVASGGVEASSDTGNKTAQVTEYKRERVGCFEVLSSRAGAQCGCRFDDGSFEAGLEFCGLANWWPVDRNAPGGGGPKGPPPAADGASYLEFPTGLQASSR